MKFSLTVPQLFYDVIARVLPGFFFLILLKVLMQDTGISLEVFRISPTDNAVMTLGYGLGYLFIFYLTGWLLEASVFLSTEKKIKHKFNRQINYENVWLGENIKIDDMFQLLRLRHPEAGFRVVKLRAEARMLESTRCAMYFIILTFLVICLLGYSGFFVIERISPLSWGIKFIVPLIIFERLRKLEKPAWKRYFGNVSRIYKLISMEMKAKGENKWHFD